jgi:iron complex outermembrane receptor protein
MTYTQKTMSRGLFKHATKLSAIALAVSCAYAGAQENTNTELEEVVVTGSRVVTDGSQAPTPVTTMTAEDLNMAAPSNLPDALNKLPQFAGSYNQNMGGTFNATSEPLGNYLNLRGLDSSRVLTMLNGQRLAPTGQTNAVDSNIIPQLLVKRVDIVTGGASAAYGSDAVSGVVNYILDNKFEGLKIDVNGGQSAEGDNESYKVAVAGGFEVTEGVNVILSAEKYENDGIPHLYDRAWATGPGRQIARSGSGTAADPYTTADMGGWIGQSVHRCIGIFQDCFDQSGNLIPFFATPVSDQATFGTPDSGGTSITGTLDTERYFGNVTFALTDSVEGHVQAIYSESRTTFNSTPNNTTRGTVGYNRSMRVFPDNPFLTASSKAALEASGQPFWGLTGLYNDIGLVTNDTNNKYTSYQIGFKGDINDKWSWDATYNYGKSEQSIAFNEFKMKEVWAAMDVVTDSSGNAVCGVTLRNPGFMDDCRPLNIMGAYNFTQEARDYVRGDSIKDITNEMKYLNFNMSGELMDLPGGPLAVAFGAEMRTQDLEVVSNSDPAEYTNADASWKAVKFVTDHYGIRGMDDEAMAAAIAYEAGQISGNELQAVLDRGTVPGFSALRYSSVNQGGAAGDQSVTEFYAEMNAPLTDTFSVNLAARSTDYKTSGEVVTWKGGISWNPIDSVRIRATQSRDIAAPTLSLMYAAPNPSFGQFIDPHIKIAADGSPATIDDQTIVPLYVSQGNSELKPEASDTTTIGIVFQPESIEGLTVSVDWYNIEIEDAFGNLSPGSISDQCEASNGTASVCKYIIRPFAFENRTIANAATQINMVPFNLAMLSAEGIDFEASYSFDAFGGTVDLRGFVNHAMSFTTQQTVNDAVIERAGYTIPGSPSSGNSLALPEWKGMLMQTYTNGGLSVMLSERFTGSSKLGLPGQVWDKNDPNIPGGNMPNEMYVDLNVSYRFGSDDNYQAYFNAQNITDIDPPVTPGLAPNLTVTTDKMTYDVIGATYTVGLRATF